MKRIVFILLLISVFFTSCGSGDDSIPEASQSSLMHYGVVSYDTLEEFYSDYSKLQSENSIVSSAMGTPEAGIKSEATIYAPTYLLEKYELININFSEYYVDYIFGNASGDAATASFSWQYGNDPEVLLAGYPADGALKDWIVKGEGIEFYIEEHPMSSLGENQTGLRIVWICDNEGFIANVPSSFTDDEIKKLSQLENIAMPK